MVKDADVTNVTAHCGKLWYFYDKNHMGIIIAIVILYS